MDGRSTHRGRSASASSRCPMLGQVLLPSALAACCFVAARESASMRIHRWMVVLCVGVGGCATEPRRVSTFVAPRWITSVEHCKVWDPHPLAGEVASWSGSCIDGFAEGRGRLTWKSPRPASGPASGNDQAPDPDAGDLRTTSVDDQQMTHGLGQGHTSRQVFDVNTGKLRYTVDGNLEDGRPEGQGTLTTPQGLRYVGGFHLGRLEGHGVSQFPNGNRYDGGFRDGFWEGHGVLTWGRGNSYEGDFHLGRADGSGTLTYVRPGSDGKPPVTLTGRWQGGCFIDPVRYGCLQTTRS